VHGDIAVVGLDTEFGLARDHEGMVPVVGKPASGRESGHYGDLNWQAHEHGTPLLGITHKEARMFPDKRGQTHFPRRKMRLSLFV